MSEPLIKADDVAQFLGVSRTWVFQAARSGLLPSVRMGGIVRFRQADIEAFVDSATKGGK